jgi:hypothetical protein
MQLWTTVAKRGHRTRMNITGRTSLIILLVGLFLFLGFLFSSFILENFVTPVALVVWLFLRMLRGVDQAIYWNLLILSAMGYACIRFVRRTQKPPVFEQTRPSDSDVTREHINYWWTSIRLTGDETDRFNLLKRNLGEMVATMYAAKQPEVPPFEIYDAMKRRRIPLPEHIHAFLFPADPSGAGRSFRQILHAILQIPGKWVRRWTGQDVVDYYHSVEEVIRFMESAMEIKHGDELIDTHPH